jgi:hypothetical protein
MNDPYAPAAHAPPCQSRSRSLSGRAIRVLGAWLALEVVLVLLTFGWVAIYSHVLAPGHAPAHYEDYARRASPVVALVISAPVFGAFGFSCGRRRGKVGGEFARATTALFLVIDAALVASVAGASGGVWIVWSAAGALKVAGVVFGGRIGARAADAWK